MRISNNVGGCTATLYRGESWAFIQEGDRYRLAIVTSLKFTDNTCIIGCVSDSNDLSNCLYEVKSISNQCHGLGLLLKSTKT